MSHPRSSEIDPVAMRLMAQRTTALLGTMKAEGWTTKQAAFICLRAGATLAWNAGMRWEHVAGMIPKFYAEFGKRRN